MFMIYKRHFVGNLIVYSSMQSSHHFRYQSKPKIRDIEDDAEKIRRLKGLPKGLHLPYEMKNPWMKPAFEEDFILITEFAENEGPRDVLTIPSNGGGSFDKNAFALHVMSVDFQSQNRNAEFNITDDTQMVLSDKKTGMCAFVHHFTLYDIHARGYVRPFCMSYITDNKKKILSCLHNIVREFQKIAKLFHMGNRVAFGMDLEQRLVELLSFNEQLLCSWNPKIKSNVDEKTENMQKEIYQQTFCETKKVIDVLKPHLNDPIILEKFKKLESQAELQKQSLTSETSQTAIAGEGAEAEEVSKIEFTEHSPTDAMRRARSLSSLEDLKTDDNETGSFKSFAPSYLQNMKQLRNLHELCGLGAKEGINRLRNFVQDFSQEEIAISIEKTEGSQMDPSTSLLSLGRSVVLNFTSGVDLKKSMAFDSGKYHANHLFMSVLQRRLSLGSGGSGCSTDSFKSCLDDMAFDSRRSSEGVLPKFVPSCSLNAELDYDNFDSDTTPETPSSEFSTLQFDGGSSDNLSLGSYHILDDNCLERQMSEMHIERTEPRHSFLTRKSRSLENLPSMRRNEKEDNGKQCKNKEQEILCSSFGRVAKIYGEMNYGIAEMKAPDVSPSKLEESKSREKKSLHLFKPLINKKHKLDRECSGKSSPRRPGHCHRNASLPLRCFAEEVCRPLEVQSAVSGILEFRNNYSFGIHLIYALLIARPVVILAKPENEREVRSLITTLWMFVSEASSCHGRAVIPWRKKCLHITDLPCLRLVGLCKSRRCLIPKSVERYVSILDYETGIIVSPPYKGVFLKAVFSYRTCWPSNTTLLAYIHSLFLELACKAYVLYYTYTLGPALLENKPGMDAKSNMEELEVLNRLGVHFSDAAIVRHFAEVIKQQQIDSYFHGNEEIKAQTIINDMSKCTKYRNLGPIEP